ncbi:hypothetical protein C0Q70_02298 [Pomacea canaliculata]|uniref:Endoglucanase n=1 Tax=Pomacea canaliculata TaxID=400727 RepID=A0A2T7PPJ2_POMCA|nr:hypothetical protein C0Q70_02298 [Pomacea canaliculata]
MALVAAKKGLNADQYRHWAMCQIHYILGDTGRSYVVGFGVNPPSRPHHRGGYVLDLLLSSQSLTYVEAPQSHLLVYTNILTVQS